MLTLTLSPDDARIGKISETLSKWPTTNVAGAAYAKNACTCYTLPSPDGEHWFVVLPDNVSEFSITLEKPKKAKVE
jgi:hypothetical protein